MRVSLPLCFWHKPGVIARTMSFSAILAMATSANAQVQWRSPQSAIQPALGQSVADQAQSVIGGRPIQHAVLRFAQPVDAVLRQRLSSIGITLTAPLGNDAYFAKLTGGPALDRLTAIASLQSITPIARGMKQHPLIQSGQWPAYALVGRMQSPTTGQVEDIVAVYVLYHADVPFADGVSAAASHGATVRAEMRSINALVLELPRSQVDALTDNDAVQWIEPPLPPMSGVNDSNRTLTQADTVQAAPYSLTGAGVNVLVYDAGTARQAHTDFGGRVTIRDNSGTITHATHVAGTVGGSGAASGGQFRGMATGVIMESYGLQSSGGTFLYTNPGDIEADYNQAINTFGSDIANNSIGTNTETNGFNCAIQGDYGVTDQLIDNIVRGSLGAPFRIVWAQGNERQGSRCDVEGFGDYYSTAPPAGAKNHITVGAVNSNDDSMTGFSSWGPTDDGRLKPDISGPGCQTGGDSGVTSCSNGGNNSYSSLCGTSMASPTVTGLCALLMEDYRVRYPDATDPRNSTLKILLAHNAVDRGNAGPDYQFGYGSVRIQSTIDFMRTGSFFESQVDQGGMVSTTITVPVGTPQLKVMLAWDDAPGTPNVNPALVNNLDLVVLSPGGVRAYPWTLDPQVPTAAAVRTQPNNVDNIEQVLVDSPEAGVWQVRVVGANVPQGPQPFSIAATPVIIIPPAVNILLPNGTPATMPPNTPVDIAVRITTVNDTIVPGSEQLHYRYNGGSFATAPLTPTGNGNYTATLPAANCAAVPQYYFSVQSANLSLVTNPFAAPDTFYATTVGEFVTVFDDDMETDRGWTVGDTGDNATTGIWTRVDPNGTTAQPEDDHTAAPGVNCFVTGQGPVGGGAGENDVDGGKTTLKTPTLDLTGGDATISYYRWYSNSAGGAPNADTFRVDISNANGQDGTWNPVEVVGPTGSQTSGGWHFRQFTVSSIVPPTAQVMLRFIAEDAGTGSLIEAAVDDFHIERFACNLPTCPGVLGDMNSDGQIDSGDIQGFANAIIVSPFYDPCADLAVPSGGVLDSADTSAFVALLLTP